MHRVFYSLAMSSGLTSFVITTLPSIPSTNGGNVWEDRSLHIKRFVQDLE